MDIMGRGHPAVVVGENDTMVVFDLDDFLARGGKVTDGAIIAQNGRLTVDDELGELLIRLGVAISPGYRHPTEPIDPGQSGMKDYQPPAAKPKRGPRGSRRPRQAKEVTNADSS